MVRGGSSSLLVLASSLALMAASSCRTSPAEAPAPNASAWPDEDFDPGPGDDFDPGSESSASESAMSPSSDPTGPTRPRARHTIFRDEIQRATGPGPAYLLRQLAPEPFRHQGHFVGWEITRLFPDDPDLCASPCDLALGDVILTVNGNRLQTPQELSDVLGALPSWSSLKVQSLRNGQRRQVEYAIVDAP